MLNENDVNRMACTLGMTCSEFASKHLKAAESGEERGAGPAPPDGRPPSEEKETTGTKGTEGN